MLLVACGGGQPGGSSGLGTAPDAADGRATALEVQNGASREIPSSGPDARRFLTQAAFGPDERDVVLLQRIGYSAWVDRQFALPASTFRQRWEAVDAALRAVGGTGAKAPEVVDVFWERALTGEDQLRLRVAYALSQIFVVSSADNEVEQQPRALAAWMDMLATDGLTTYRQLIERVARHPLMGRYLNHLRNQKDDGNGRVPDENFARELMQLFSIGVVKLNADDSPVLANGQQVEADTPEDVASMARVFTGWSFACLEYPSAACFHTGASASRAQDPDRAFKPMVPSVAFHTLEPKMLFGTALTPFGRGHPTAELKAALDLLDAHPNTGPSISKQLIQRLVTSNPSKACVATVAAVWANNGAGVRGDIKAVVKAILLHPEARASSRNTGGKLREPVLRLSAFLRAFPHASDTGRWRVGDTDDTASSLGRTPLRAPSVFNFYRPGYVLPNSLGGRRRLCGPRGAAAQRVEHLRLGQFRGQRVGPRSGQLQRDDRWLGLQPP